MRFLPPVRFTAPVIALFFGLVATWFDYRLNLDLDLARHLSDMRERVDANGRRLALVSEELLAADQRAALRTDVAAMVTIPGLVFAAVVDERQRIIAGTGGVSSGEPAVSSRLSKAAGLIRPGGDASVQHSEDATTVVSAHPFRIGTNGTGWVLLEFERAQSIAAAESDARTQLHWMASAMALLSFTLWAILHFCFASRLARLAAGLVAFGEGKTHPSSLPDGRDEVGKLSGAFVTMAALLSEREAEQLRLEREILEISESERQRIGGDLHDGVGQRLTATSLAINALAAAVRNSTEPVTLTIRVEEIGRQLREAIAEVRTLAHGLVPVALADDGLAIALSALAESTTRGGHIRCVFECSQAVQLPDAEIAGHLYRIAQEAVNNALKHAGASEIRIGLECQAGWIALEVEDDGHGFDESPHEPSGFGIGLRVMHYRARLIGGELEIGSAPAGGARIFCRVKMTK